MVWMAWKEPAPLANLMITENNTHNHCVSNFKQPHISLSHGDKIENMGLIFVMQMILNLQG